MNRKFEVLSVTASSVLVSTSEDGLTGKAIEWDELEAAASLDNAADLRLTYKRILRHAITMASGVVTRTHYPEPHIRKALEWAGCRIEKLEDNEEGWVRIHGALPDGIDVYYGGGLFILPFHRIEADGEVVYDEPGINRPFRDVYEELFQNGARYADRETDPLARSIVRRWEGKRA